MKKLFIICLPFLILLDVAMICIIKVLITEYEFDQMAFEAGAAFCFCLIALNFILIVLIKKLLKNG